MRYFVNVRDQLHEVEVDGDRVRLDGKEVSAKLLGAAGSHARALRMGSRSHDLVNGVRDGDQRVLHVDGRAFRVTVVDERSRRIREMTASASGPTGPRPIKAPMPGLVVKVEVEEGQVVEPGQGLVIVEAMKMENELKAEAGGVVARILVEAGQAVEKDQVLLDFQAPAEAEDDT